MTDISEASNDDLIGLFLMNLIDDDPSLANERIGTFYDMEPRGRDAFLAAIDAVDLAMDDEPFVTLGPSYYPAWYVRLQTYGEHPS